MELWGEERGDTESPSPQSGVFLSKSNRKNHLLMDESALSKNKPRDCVTEEFVDSELLPRWPRCHLRECGVEPWLQIRKPKLNQLSHVWVWRKSVWTEWSWSAADLPRTAQGLRPRCRCRSSGTVQKRWAVHVGTQCSPLESCSPRKPGNWDLEPNLGSHPSLSTVRQYSLRKLVTTLFLSSISCTVQVTITTLLCSCSRG